MKEVGVAGGDVLGVRGWGLSLSRRSRCQPSDSSTRFFFPLASSRSRKQEKPFLRSIQWSLASRRAFRDAKIEPGQWRDGSTPGWTGQRQTSCCCTDGARQRRVPSVRLCVSSHDRPLETAQQREQEQYQVQGVQTKRASGKKKKSYGTMSCRSDHALLRVVLQDLLYGGQTITFLFF